MSAYIIEFSKKGNLDICIKQVSNINIQNITGTIVQEGNSFTLNLQGKQENAICILRSIWELASLYEGYFYKPDSYFIDGIRMNINDLYFLPFYKTGEIWKNFAMPLVGTNKDFSASMINKYITFRNKGRKTGCLNKQLINSFYYLHSENYDKINVNHRLSLLLNLCDGLAINIYGTKNVKSGVAKIIKKTMASQKVKYGATLLGIPEEKLYHALAEERNEMDHYSIKDGSVSDYEMQANEPIREHINFYFTYVVELAIRIALLNILGCNCEQRLIDDALDIINDWIILDCNLNVECGKEINRFRQKLRKLGMDIK